MSQEFTTTISIIIYLAFFQSGYFTSQCAAIPCVGETTKHLQGITTSFVNKALLLDCSSILLRRIVPVFHGAT